jgi:FMN phosphatase YigB (HAD superfamily)
MSVSEETVTLARVASFDVFDTTLTRLVGSPHSVFLLLGRQLRCQSLITCSEKEFMELRVRAERCARRNVPSREVTLNQIYDVLRVKLGLTHGRIEKIMAMEYALEETLIRPVPGAQERIQQARDEKKRVVFSSDMYLSADFLRRQLQRHGFWQDGDALYLSNECGKTKHTGGLFQEIMLREAVSPFHLEHWGDNLHSDVRGAERVGVQTYEFWQGNLNRYEHILESFASETHSLSSIMAGASRLARLETVEPDPHDHNIAVVSAGVAAPVLTSFVLWILFKARDMGMERIYFVSRDGEILLDIARQLIPAVGFEIECRYLYGSRQAWHLPSIVGEIGEAELNWILEPTRFLSVRTVLKRVALEPEAIADELTSADLDRSKWDCHLSPMDRARLREVLVIPCVQAQIREAAEQARSTVTDYFRQEGLFDPIKMAIVDLGWRGRAFHSLSILLKQCGGELPKPFYFGMVSKIQSSALDERETFLFDVDRACEIDTRAINLRIWNLMEVFCSGYEGAASTYVRNGDRVTVEFQIARNGPVIDWGLPVLRRAVTQFAGQVADGLTFTDPSADGRAMCSALLAEFWERPTRAEAQAWGAYPYEDDQTGSHWEHLAMPVGWSSLRLALYDIKAWRRSRPIWMAGSLAMSPMSVRAVFRSLMRIRSAWLSFQSRASELRQ